MIESTRPAPALFLFDDARARRWTPFAPTRPVGELLYGRLLQRERAERFWGAPFRGQVAAPHLRGFDETGASPVLVPDDLPGRLPDDAPAILFSSRAVPGGEAPDPGRVGETTALRMGGETVGWVVPAGGVLPAEEELMEPAAGGGSKGPEAAALELEGHVLGWPWELVSRNAARIHADVTAAHRPGDSFLLTDVHLIGEHPVSLGDGARVEPGVVLDVTEGPIRLDRNVRVRGPARLTGPLHVGADSVILGGQVGTSSIGPVCKIRGEVEASVILGYCNKAHDGYLGHAYLGRWVNLGALTTNSDLKNSYGDVRVPLSADEEADTRLMKVGSFLGDHVKTGIGTLLDTGCVLGAGSNVFGGAMPPRWVPPFSWGAGDELVEYRLDKFLEVAATAMARREVDLTEGMREVLSRAWHASGAAR